MPVGNGKDGEPLTAEAMGSSSSTIGAEVQGKGTSDVQSERTGFHMSFLLVPSLQITSLTIFAGIRHVSIPSILSRLQKSSTFFGVVTVARLAVLKVISTTKPTLYSTRTDGDAVSLVTETGREKEAGESEGIMKANFDDCCWASDNHCCSEGTQPDPKLEQAQSSYYNSPPDDTNNDEPNDDAQAAEHSSSYREEESEYQRIVGG